MNDNTGKKAYVLVTPTRNEEAYIEKTIQSVVKQTILPKRWVIVNDGSTDSTTEIVRKYAINFNFIRLVELPKRKERHFAGKVNAIKAGFNYLGDEDYEFYGNLDADVSFDSKYYEILLDKFEEDPALGISGGRLYDKINEKFVKLNYSSESVAGPIQFFRRKCYEDIGGYVLSKAGLVDAMAEVTARMKGWQTSTFSELKVFHHRKTGSEGRNIWQVTKREGSMDYLFGVYPLWNLFRSLQRINKKPYIIGSIIRIYGYWDNQIKKVKRPVSDEFISYLRKEEKSKMRLFLLQKIGIKNKS